MRGRERSSPLRILPPETPDTNISHSNETDFQSLAEHSADIICRVVGHGLLLGYVSPSSERILGWKPEEMMGKGPAAFVHPDDLSIVAEAAIQLRSAGPGYAPVRYRMLKKDGQSVWMEVSARIVPGASEGDAEVVLVMRDVTDRKALEEQLEALALTDGLTGLSNRRAFDDALQREWLRALRDRSHVSLLLIDLDRFKEINDRYGHPIGDYCLRAVAAVIQRTVRATDTVSRYGGEEIAVILPSADGAGAAETAEKIRSAIESLHLPHNDDSVAGSRLTGSVGAATALFGGGITSITPQRLLKAADLALYEAKHEGRNRVAAVTISFPEAE